ncbi:unnamed protein product, partial [Amoebophrya sp. A25]|eukprot:GSA25T00026887001.1
MEDDRSLTDHVVGNRSTSSSSAPSAEKGEMEDDRSLTDHVSQDGGAMETVRSLTKSLELAPMLDVTTREFRYFLRLLTRRMTNWTEMVVDKTILHASDLDQHLGYCEAENPLVLQIGGNDPESCARASEIAWRQYGYKEVNLNVGCPSDRVSGKGEFGAVLMLKKDIVFNVVSAIRERCGGFAGANLDQESTSGASPSS